MRGLIISLTHWDFGILLQNGAMHKLRITSLTQRLQEIDRWWFCIVWKQDTGKVPLQLGNHVNTDYINPYICGSN